MIDQKLLERIQKVQRLTTSSNINEAAAAATKLQELLFKHNLDLRDIEVPDEEQVGATYLNRSYDIKYGDNWRRGLLAGIARSNFCDTVYLQGTSIVYVIGEPAIIEVVLSMYEYLSATVIRLSNQGWREEGRYRSARQAAWKNSFRAGATNVIYQRLEQRKRELTNQTEQTMAMVLDKESELLEAFRRVHPSTSMGKGTRNTDASGYRSGVVAGRTIGLEAQVGGGAKPAPSNQLGAGR
jgi:hypothetical protein